jgi:nuclear pore complex protein Nup205
MLLACGRRFHGGCVPHPQALLHVLGPGFGDINTSALQPAAAGAAATPQDAGGAADPLAARQAAVLAALRVLNKALRLDAGFVDAAAALSPPVRYQQLDALLQSGAGARPAALGGGGLALALLTSGGGGAAAEQVVPTLLLYVCYQDNEDIQVVLCTMLAYEPLESMLVLGSCLFHTLYWHLAAFDQAARYSSCL